MQIYLAKTAGFCFGVDRAVSLVEQAIRDGKHAVTLGPIIHNRHVVERFAKLGVREIASPDEAQPGETVILRAHGVEKAMQEALAARGLEVVDATCPFVEKIHKIVQRAEQLRVGETLEITLRRGSVSAEVREIREESDGREIKNV